MLKYILFLEVINYFATQKQTKVHLYPRITRLILYIIMHHLDYYTAEKNIFMSNDHTFKSFEYAVTFEGNYRFVIGS